ncbi:hypothetical protein E2P81_ATG00055 [Venturia nashicola]|nr:hypothetical protein E2P81_ATG00055 [Venturia nashicola]
MVAQDGTDQQVKGEAGEEQVKARRDETDGKDALLKHESLTKTAPKCTLWDKMRIALFTAPGCSETWDSSILVCTRAPDRVCTRAPDRVCTRGPGRCIRPTYQADVSDRRIRPTYQTDISDRPENKAPGQVADWRATMRAPLRTSLFRRNLGTTGGRSGSKQRGWWRDTRGLVRDTTGLARDTTGLARDTGEGYWRGIRRDWRGIRRDWRGILARDTGEGYDGTGEGYDGTGEGYDGTGEGYDGTGEGYDGTGEGYDGTGEGYWRGITTRDWTTAGYS